MDRDGAFWAWAGRSTAAAAAHRATVRNFVEDMRDPSWGLGASDMNTTECRGKGFRAGHEIATIVSRAGNGPAWLVGGLVSGKDEAERCAFAQRALKRHAAVVCLDQVLDDGESQARSALFAGPARVHAIKTFEDPRQVLGRDSRPGVADRQLDALGSGQGRYGDFSTRLGVSDGVLEQIGKDFP